MIPKGIAPKILNVERVILLCSNGHSNPSALSTARAEWLQIEAQLRTLLQNSIRASGRDVTNHRFFASGKITGMNIACVETI